MRPEERVSFRKRQKVMLQVSGDGPLQSVVAEADWGGRVRGYVKRPHIHLAIRDGKLDVGRAIGNGFLNVIKDLGIRLRDFDPLH